jgi:hypothetical protein
MPLHVLGAIQATGLRARLDSGQQRRARLLRTFEVGVDVVDIDEDAVDDPGRCGPCRGRVTISRR